MKQRQSYYLVILFIAITFLTILPGCAFKVPVNVNPAKDMKQAFHNNKRIPIKVGLYIDDDTKNYVYKQQKMGMTFFMQAGSYLYTISKEMALQMFQDVVYVDSLPPYDDSYRPDVEAVVTPEFLYCYGDAVGTVSGHITAKVIFQVTAYDLSGDVVWQGKATGAKKSGEIDFVSSFLGGMGDIGTIGYQAAFASAVKIINNFYASPPEKLLTLLEVKKGSSIKHHDSKSKQFMYFFEKGKANFTRKNYHQALYCFQRASEYTTKTAPSTAYFIGACYAYTGNIDQALTYFNKAVTQTPSSWEGKLAQQEIKQLNSTFKIGVVFSGQHADINDIFYYKNIIVEHLEAIGTYEVIDLTNVAPKRDDIKRKDFTQYLGKQYNQGLRAVIYISGKYSYHPSVSGQQVGDIATNIDLNLTSKVFSTKKKKIIKTIKLSDQNNIITGTNIERVRTVSIKKTSDRLISKLIQAGLI